jgi:hypothetical protein
VRFDLIQGVNDHLFEFNIATNTFTPKHAGYYVICPHVYARIAAGVPQIYALNINVNGVVIGTTYRLFDVNGTLYPLTFSMLLYLTPNDAVTIGVTGYLAPNIVSISAGTAMTFLSVWSVR